MKLCRDCRWIQPQASSPECGHPSAAWSTISPVDGQTHGQSCEMTRTRWGECGPDANLWKPNAGPVGFGVP
jgi:hypothetical protein